MYKIYGNHKTRNDGVNHMCTSLLLYDIYPKVIRKILKCLTNLTSGKYRQEYLLNSSDLYKLVIVYL